MISFPYPGGKGRLAKTICSFAPKSGDVYCEPFAGRGNVFWFAAQTLKFKRWWLNDLRTIPFLESIRRIGDTIVVPFRTQAEWVQTRDDYQTYRNSDSEEARVLEPFLTHNGAGYGTGGPRSSGGGATSAGYTNTLRASHKIMHTTKVRTTAVDWSKVVSRLGPGDFPYVDGPYLNADTRSYKEDDIDHAQLLKVLKGAKFRWILSHYPHPLYISILGKPFFAQDMQFSRVKDSPDTRTECLWRNFSDGKGTISIPKHVQGEIRTMERISSLSFNALDARIDEGLGEVARDLRTMLPYLQEMKTRLRAQGRRTDLRRGAPKGLTWTQWVESKRSKLGRSLRTIQYLLKGEPAPTGARHPQILEPEPRAALREVRERGVIHNERQTVTAETTIELGVQMAKMILDGDPGSSKERLIDLAQRFLQLYGASSVARKT